MCTRSNSYSDRQSFTPSMAMCARISRNNLASNISPNIRLHRCLLAHTHRIHTSAHYQMCLHKHTCRASEMGLCQVNINSTVCLGSLLLTFGRAALSLGFRKLLPTGYMFRRKMKPLEDVRSRGFVVDIFCDHHHDHHHHSTTRNPCQTYVT